MKKIILYSTILMLLLSKIINAQSTAQTFPIINLSIAPGYDRSIEDFYGLNGQNTLSATSMYANTNVNSGLAASYASYLRYPGGGIPCTRSIKCILPIKSKHIFGHISSIAGQRNFICYRLKILRSLCV
jgi:hypothetical protein